MIAHLSLELLSYWHVGSGISQGARADALVLRDQDGLPYLPGRTCKGLFREALQTMVDAGHLEQETLNELLGFASIKKSSSDSCSNNGYLYFSDLRMEPDIRHWLTSTREGRQAKDRLFEIISFTSIDDNGTAKDKSVRSIEVTLPVILFGSITEDNHFKDSRTDIEWPSLFEKAASLIRYIGCHRHRGLGRCIVKLHKQPQN